MSEQVLWMFFKAGSVEAFSVIYEKYAPYLFRYGRKLTPDKKAVEDSIHDLFIELWDKRNQLNKVTSIKYYLSKCLYRKMMKGSTKKDSLTLDEKNHCAPVPSIEDAILQREETFLRKLIFHRQINNLTQKERDAIYLKYYKDFSMEKIALALSLSKKSTYNLLSRGIVALRQNLRVPLE